MYTIGQFSRIGMVSTSALRFYDDKGLLKPCSVDYLSGYRYYSEAQIDDILFITEMREYGFSLDEIKTLMNNNTISLEPALRKKYDSLFWEEQKITYIRRKIKSKMDTLKGGSDKMETANTSNHKMDAKVVTKEENVKTVGISVEIPEWPPKNANVFGELWTKYWNEDISSNIPDKKYPHVRYGILTFEKGSVRYLITDEVTSYDHVPEGFRKFDIPKGKYAVCTFNGKTFDEMVTHSLNKATDYLLTEWLPIAGYKHAETFSLEVYDDRSRKKEYPEMDICQPVLEL
ncbi:DNA-binding transcriptional regulator, MerR family [Evansella caseinilytica]|uniref:DNA-binding transcriptional regulator, MerR family n=1 Tax=Evansella caseinilytica TaxID=1503961 RepID=A0A1H3GP90_9BACI|nr:effector binding domain-containing protein [Evansella caseinilytica]SDY04139.1 DNA-binding transcriptional regulator, MerR family [Evansella caseinilytica]